MKLWTAETISQLGSQVSLLALPLIAIKVLNVSVFKVGLLSTFEYAPFLLVGLPAGVWVDRLRRRPVLICGDLGRAMALFSIPLAHGFGVLSIWQLYAVGLITGTLTVFFDVAYQSYLPALVEADRLIDGNSKLEISRSGAQLAGPGLGGVLVQLLGAPAAVLADALSFLGSAGFIGWIRRSESLPAQADTAGGAEDRRSGRGRMRRELAEGLRYVLGHPLLRWVAACTAIANLFGMVSFAIFVFFAVRELGMSPGLIGATMSVGNLGWLAGAALARPMSRRFGIGWTILIAVTVGSFPGILVPLAPKGAPVPFLLVPLLCFGFGAVTYNIAQVSMRQAITPHALLGRMNATMRFIVWGVIPIGGFIGGVLGKSIGLRPTIWIGVVGSSLAVVPVALTKVRSVRTIEDAITMSGIAKETERG
jgi:MFS family permease